MYSLKEFLIERANDYSYNSPDNIHIENDDDHDSLSWMEECAYAFIYSLKLNDFLFSGSAETHSSILYSYDDDTLKEFDDLYDAANNKGIYDLRFITGDSDYKSYKDWKTLNPFSKRFKLGRIWIYKKVLYIAWWDDLKSAEFIKYNNAVIKYIKKDPQFDEFDKIYYMNNNGELLEFDPNKKVRAARPSKKRKEILKIQQAIHLANQKEKREFFKEFRKHRDEANQKIYNTTKSKTEAEYRSIRYQGDSLIDNEKNRIND